MIYTETGNLLTILVAALLAAGIARKWDRDPGGYQDGWATSALFKDKLVHMAVAIALTFALCRLMPVSYAASGTILIGLAYELGGGYISWYDWAADAAGAVLVYGYMLLTD